MNLKHEMMCLYIDGFVIYVKYTNACIRVSMNIWEWRCDCFVHVAKWILVFFLKHQQLYNETHINKKPTIRKQQHTNLKWPKSPGCLLFSVTLPHSLFLSYSVCLIQTLTRSQTRNSRYVSSNSDRENKLSNVIFRVLSFTSFVHLLYSRAHHSFPL